MSDVAERAVPALSVVVVVFAGGRLVTRCLSALGAQQGISATPEIIVAAAAGALESEVEREVRAAGRLIEGPAGAHPARLRSLGVRAAGAPIVACTEDHCIPAPNWCERIMAAQRPPVQVVGGAIQKLTPDAAVAWAAYLLEYGRYMPPLPAGPAPYLSDCNVSYRRAALDEIESLWRDSFHETAVHDSIRARWGHAALLLDPSVVVLQSRRPALGSFIKERFEHGRLFATLRTGSYGTLGRVAYSAAALGLAPLLVGRAMLRVLARGHDRAAAVRALPFLAAAAIAWSAGESAGAFQAPEGEGPRQRHA